LGNLGGFYRDLLTFSAGFVRFSLFGKPAKEFRRLLIELDGNPRFYACDLRISDAAVLQCYVFQEDKGKFLAPDMAYSLNKGFLKFLTALHQQCGTTKPMLMCVDPESRDRTLGFDFQPHGYVDIINAETAFMYPPGY
jgi:hypothetical protein